jgi:hypothetical protein
MNHNRWTTVFGAMVIGLAAAAGAGDLVVDGAVATTGGWYEFADGSVQTSAAYPRWAQVAVVDVQGRGDYTDPVAAMAALPTWCGTPSMSNPCLLKILPGYYDIGSSSLWMQPYVDIEGSGRDVTLIRSARNEAVVYGAELAELRSLTVINEGDEGSPQGIYIGYSWQRPRVTDVDVVVSGAGTDNTGVRIVNSEPVIDSMNVYVSGGNSAWGIVALNCTGALHNVDVHASTVTGDYAVGIELGEGSTTLLKNSQVHASGGTICYGIQTISASPLIDGVTVMVQAEGDGFGVRHAAGTATITNSSIEVAGGGSTIGVRTKSSGVSILRGVRILARHASGSNTGVGSSGDAQVRLEQVNITAWGGVYSHAVDNWGGSETTLIDVTAEAGVASTFNYGVLNQDSSFITATNLIAKASGGTGSYGVLNANDGGTVTIDRSSVTGTSSSVRNDNDSAGFFVGLSKLVGPVSTHLTCFGNYDASYGGVVCP